MPTDFAHLRKPYRRLLRDQRRYQHARVHGHRIALEPSPWPLRRAMAKRSLLLRVVRALFPARLGAAS